MKRLTLILISSFNIIFSCASPEGTAKQQTQLNAKADSIIINVDSFPEHINFKPIGFQQINGTFEYYENDLTEKKYSSVFLSEKEDFIVRYHQISGNNKSDTLEFNGTLFQVKGISGFDPLSMEIFHYNSKEQNLILFKGKSGSASGSGVYNDFFALLNQKDKKSSIAFMSSFFGSEKSFGTCGGTEGELLFLKLKPSLNTPEMYEAYLYDPFALENALSKLDIEVEYILNRKFSTKSQPLVQCD
ncbi:hypothetical protein QWY85_10720 [Neolewinella lacunae]|uniref:Lipoprotein n=1 Tax=Neolewinella lacunae TaxID=1517758 RepID=A0A923T688_9BACT|nr:hypothetical protein [Neolewinella lacunae]MBC6993160.1 hypothetical protein [Neolewinella lacunae]MDN3635131.1 hypothetical protein [Neolewinella lacunae]